LINMNSAFIINFIMGNYYDYDYADDYADDWAELDNFFNFN